MSPHSSSPSDLSTTRLAFDIAAGADTAGVNVRLARAFQESYRQTGWWMALMTGKVNYLRYPQDETFDLGRLYDLYDRADVIVTSSTTHAHEFYDNGQGKPLVVMHHGFHSGHFERDIYGCVAEAHRIGATQIGTTVNLELLSSKDGPTVSWVPTTYDLPALAHYRDDLYSPNPDRRVQIVHAPTIRAVKGTEIVIQAVKSLQERGLSVDLVLIEGQTHAKTLEIKAKCGDLLVDQLELGYGCNAIEAWALGMPVIAGFSPEHADWRAHAQARYALAESPTGLPFFEASPATLEATIEAFVRSKDLRKTWAAIGMAHIVRHHAPWTVVPLMADILDEARLHPTDRTLSNRSRRVRFQRVTGVLAQRVARYQERHEHTSASVPSRPEPEPVVSSDG